MGKKVKRVFRSNLDPAVKLELIKDNMKSLQTISLTAMIVESVVLILFLMTSDDPFGAEFVSTESVIICIVVSAIVWGILHYSSVHQNRIHSNIHIQRVLMIIYYLVLAHWGMIVSLRHYRVSEQMLTFFIVMMIFVSFINIRPLSAALLIIGAYLEFYLILLRVDQGAKINAINYFAMAILSFVASQIRYRRQVIQFSTSLEFAALNEQLEQLSVTDALTGLGNRLAVRKRVEAVVGTTVCVMLADVDLFKDVNDNGGHDAGDAVLVHIAEQLRDVYPGNSCFRYGGDEFLVITSGMSEEEFLKRRKRWQRQISGVRIRNVRDYVNCSSGVVCGNPKSEEEVRELIHQADDQLYIEKREHHKNV